jgi:hypothetical protein
MASASPLTGAVLVDCAKANVRAGLAIAAERCGYSSDVEAFQTALTAACTEMGISIESLTDMEPSQNPIIDGIAVAPETPSDL